MAKHKELVWLAVNLKLEVTKNSRQIQGPARYAHQGDDDGGGDGDDPETNPSYRKRKRHYR